MSTTSSEPSMDILADLDGTPRRAPGYPCVIAEMRQQDPPLADQFAKVVAAKRRGTVGSSYADIAAWFTARKWDMSDNTVGVHVRNKCSTCRRAAA